MVSIELHAQERNLNPSLQQPPHESSRVPGEGFLIQSSRAVISKSDRRSSKICLEIPSHQDIRDYLGEITLSKVLTLV